MNQLLRSHSYPGMQVVAQVAQLDDEAAFRLADLENRARADVSNLERARNYLGTLKAHDGNHHTRISERPKLSKRRLSKMLKGTGIPDAVIAAFASPADVQLKPAYALDDKNTVRAITTMAWQVAKEQAGRREAGKPPYSAADALRRLLDAPRTLSGEEKPAPYRYATKYGRTALTVQSLDRQGMTIRLHAGWGRGGDQLGFHLNFAL